jgi:pyruvate dehydrogenase E2 component (dihydrolipoamide acetyltransferase)
MAIPVLMPKQGQSVESCIITDWFKQKGDKVNKGDILFAYETDKASFEEECPADGILLELFFDAGDEVPVLTNVAVVGNEGESVDEFRPGGESAVKEETKVENEKIEPETPIQKEIKTTASASETGKQKISPRAKRIAEQKRISLEGLQGSGPKGRIIERDVLNAMETQPKLSALASKIAKEEDLVPGESGSGIAGTYTAKDMTQSNAVYSSDFEEKPLTNIRKLIAKAMHNSLQNSAQLTHHLSADARKMLALRKKSKALVSEGKGPNITLNDLVCFAVINALKKHPEANIHFLGESIRYFNKIHLGMAVDTERGLMVPAVKNADDLSLSGLSSQLKAVAESCKTGSVDPDLLSSEAATFTISNLGNYGVEMFTPVLNVPQACILGVNTIIQRPAPLGDGSFGFVPYIGLSLTYDHRALDGGPATKLLAEIKNEIENLDLNLI